MADPNIRLGATAAPSAAIDAGLRTYMLRVYNYMTVGTAITGLTAWLVANTALMRMTPSGAGAQATGGTDADTAPALKTSSGAATHAPRNCGVDMPRSVISVKRQHLVALANQSDHGRGEIAVAQLLAGTATRC